jgi:glycerophosphoryl diester phosphodiesterase
MSENSEWIINAPQVIAHRGASGYAPENTLAAFKRAVDLGSQAVELDAKLLKDGSIIVIHDNTLDRTTNGSGSVYQFEYNEIMDLDAGSHYSRTFDKEKIPKLEEVFNQIGDRIPINVELTNIAHPLDQLPQKVIELIRRYKLERSVLLSSFNPWALIVARKVEPKIPRALLVQPVKPKFLLSLIRRMVNHEIYHPHQDMLNEKEMERIKINRKLVNAWTVNDRSQMMKLLKLGVDGIITDYPDIAREVIQEIKGKN